MKPAVELELEAVSPLQQGLRKAILVLGVSTPTLAGYLFVDGANFERVLVGTGAAALALGATTLVNAGLKDQYILTFWRHRLVRTRRFLGKSATSEICPVSDFVAVALMSSARFEPTTKNSNSSSSAAEFEWRYGVSLFTRDGQEIAVTQTRTAGYSEVEMKGLELATRLGLPLEKGGPKTSCEISRKPSGLSFKWQEGLKKRPIISVFGCLATLFPLALGWLLAFR